MGLENLEPITRIEHYLAKIAGEDVVTPEVKTRLEAYLAKIAGADIIVPEAKTRLEYFLNEIAENGEGGGGETGYTTCQVTINLNTQSLYPENILIPHLSTDWYGYPCISAYVSSNLEEPLTVVLYNGKAVMNIEIGIDMSVVTSGNIESYGAPSGAGYIITGDCTITINDSGEN